MSLIRQLAGQTIIYGLGHILSKVLYFIVLTTYLTNRLPDTREFGIYAELYAYASILIVVLSYRIDTAFFRFGSDKGKMSSAFSSAFSGLLCTTILLVGLVFMFSQNIAQLIGYEDKPHYIQWFALIIGFDVLALLPYAKMRLQNLAKKFILFRLFNVLLTIALVLLFLEILPGSNLLKSIQKHLPTISSDVDFVFLSNLLASFLVFVCMIPFVLKTKWRIDFSLWKKMFWYALPLVIVGIAGSFNQFFAAPLQKFLLGASYEENLTQAGIYAAPQKIAALLALFTTAFNYAAEPFFFRNKTHKDSKELYGKICLLFTMVGGIAVLILFFYIDLFQYLIGPNYREGLVIVPILLMAYLLMGIYYNISIWYKLADKTYFGAAIALIGASITFAFSLFFLPRIGYIASAWAAVLTFLTMNLIAYFLGQRHYKIQYPNKKIVFVLLIIVLTMWLGYLTDKKLQSYLIAFAIKSFLLLGYIFTIYKMESTTFRAAFNRSKS